MPHPGALEIEPQFAAESMRSSVKGAVRAVVGIGIDRSPEIIGAIGIFQRRGLLSSIAVASEVLVQKTWRDLICGNGFYG